MDRVNEEFYNQLKIMERGGFDTSNSGVVLMLACRNGYWELASLAESSIQQGGEHRRRYYNLVQKVKEDNV